MRARALKNTIKCDRDKLDGHRDLLLSKRLTWIYIVRASGRPSRHSKRASSKPAFELFAQTSKSLIVHEVPRCPALLQPPETVRRASQFCSAHSAPFSKALPSVQSHPFTLFDPVASFTLCLGSDRLFLVPFYVFNATVVVLRSVIVKLAGNSARY